MLITFLGTRGEIEIRSRAHRRHSATLFDAGERTVMIDCGLDWLASVSRLDVAAILLTHAHPDHAGGLRDGCACPVYATAATSQAIARFEIADLRVVEPRVRFVLAGMTFEAFPVEHSLRAPAVGFRISCRSGTAFYVPDVIAVPERAAALRGSTSISATAPR